MFNRNLLIILFNYIHIFNNAKITDYALALGNELIKALHQQLFYKALEN